MRQFNAMGLPGIPNLELSPRIGINVITPRKTDMARYPLDFQRDGKTEESTECRSAQDR